MNIRVVGNGFIASHLPYEQMRIDTGGSYDDLVRSLYWDDRNLPNVIINCIGYCGKPNIDACEGYKQETSYANTVLPIMLANACNKQGVRFIHIGSGCIYSGRSPNFDYQTEAFSSKKDYGWRENDTANPQSYYAKTKYAADLAIADLPNTTILRIRMPVSPKPHPRNLINKLIDYPKVLNEPNSMTFMSDFVRVVQWMIDNDKRGIWHITNPGTLTAADIMTEYQRYVPSHKFETITADQLYKMTTAKRSNCILNGDKLKQAGFKMTPAKDALKETMTEYCKGRPEFDFDTVEEEQ
jgi:dTDP-4-dehydrorhamnose reductase